MRNARSKLCQPAVLGIETSCDETAASVVRGDRAILSNLVLSQITEHEAFGGVVPEIAARAHLDHLDTLIAAALKDAGTGFTGLDAIAATCGPGLIGGVMVGMMAGKAIASARNLPFIAVNHLEAHALTPRLVQDVPFPYLLLLVSGGHTQLIAAEAVGCYKCLGTTRDDALGEAFDKSAKLMGLPFPGGPNLEKAALACRDPEKAGKRFPLPRPMAGKPGCDFSFSGLKTALRKHVRQLTADTGIPGQEDTLEKEDIAALASAFQTAVTEILAERCARAIARFKEEYGHKTTAFTTPPAFVISGGVASNLLIRNELQKLADHHDMAFVAPPGNLCSDNGAMIAWTGIEKLRQNRADPLDVPARPRWPLDPEAQGGVTAA